MKKRIFTTATLLCFAFCSSFLAYLYFNQDNMLFFAETTPREYTYSYKEKFEEVYLDTPDGACIHALHFQVKNPKGVILYFHGRASNLETYWGRVGKAFTKRGYDIFIADYRGFGKSTGLRTEQTMLSDAVLQYEHLLTKYDKKDISLYGRSLGTGIATYVASNFDAKQLFLEAPYLSMLDLANRKFSLVPKFLLKKILNYPLHLDQWITDVSCPIHIFHGTCDGLIPYACSEELFQICPDNTASSLITIQGGEHNNLFHFPEYNEAIDKALL